MEWIAWEEGERKCREDTEQRYTRKKKRGSENGERAMRRARTSASLWPKK